MIYGPKDLRGRALVRQLDIQQVLSIGQEPDWNLACLARWPSPVGPAARAELARRARMEAECPLGSGCLCGGYFHQPTDDNRPRIYRL